MGLNATLKAPAVISGSTTTGEQPKVTRMEVPGIKVQMVILHGRVSGVHQPHILKTKPYSIMVVHMFVCREILI